jgi:hypothetical protein
MASLHPGPAESRAIYANDFAVSHALSFALSAASDQTYDEHEAQTQRRF